MNIREDIKQLKTGPRELRNFGWLVGGVFTTLGIVALLRHKPHYPYYLVPGVTLALLGTLLPRALRVLYLAWMSVAFTMGFVMAHVILALFFLLVITPIGLLARICGKDFLSLKLDRTAPTYWLRREMKSRPPAEYEKQF
jgi:hypothetical protein